MPLSAFDEFQRLQDRSSQEFVERILDLAAEHYRRWTTGGSPGQVDRARANLGRLIGGTSAVSEMLGRRRVRIEVDHMRRGARSLEAMKFAADDQNLLPNVSPERAIEDLVKRDPRLADGYKRVQELYSKERAFALAKSSDLATTKKVQEIVGEALAKGHTLPKVEDLIAKIGGWARGYGEVVFRTNLNTTYANGRFLEAQDPDLEGFIVGLERMEVLDSDTRHNHRAADGLTAGLRDPIWLRLGLPGGYNCRGSYRLVDRYEAERRGLLTASGQMRTAQAPPGAYNDPGFDNKVSFSLMGLM
jgi:hypothetical protein